MVAILALAGLITAGASSSALQADQARRLVALGGVAGELAAQMQRERVLAALVLAGDEASVLEEYRSQAAATDTVIGSFRDAASDVQPSGGLAVLLVRVEGQLDGLDAVRQQVQAGRDVPGSVVVFRYRAVIADLISYRQGLSQVGVDAESANKLRAASALSQAIESLGLMQVAVIQADIAGRLTPAGQQEIIGADSGVTEALQAFQDLAPPGWRSALNTRVTGEAVIEAERLQGVAVRTEPNAALRLGTSATGWASTVDARMELLHAVERDLDRELRGDVSRQRDAARRSIVALAGGVLTCLFVMVLIGWWVARSLTSSLSRLREGAEMVAQRRLPRVVEQLDTNNIDRATAGRLMAEAAAPLRVDGSDEVGQVAAAFNIVAASAVRIAGEQALLRAEVSGIFHSVSRRLQRRANLLMVSLDGLERDEQDPERLRRLFDLDHVATLIRRLIANLQVLAGGRAGQPTQAAVPLPDLLRAAGQGIDDYLRVDVGEVDNAVSISPDAAVDLIHLLAELLDNAAKFSPPDSRVVVEGRRVGDLLHIQVLDRGMGLGDEELKLVRDRITHPHRIDNRTTDQMGLPVVGALAERLGITVGIRSQRHQGTQVDLTIPSLLFSSAPLRSAVESDRTAEMPAIRPRPTPAAAVSSSTPPMSWPPTGQIPQTGLTGSSAGAAAPVIFEQLSRDPRRSWFTTSDAGDEDQAPELSPAWQEAAAAAEAVRTTVPEQSTPNGLPVRQPGRRVIPPVDVATRPRVPVQRDPNALRRQMNAFHNGLGAAGRHTPPYRDLVKDPSR
ncbi:sensor histidine kinase [Micromonospora pisi]|nr:sensor histidine kinase [Micromonospora pisi]